MTAENNLNVKPLTNLHYVAPTSPSGEQPARKQRPYKRKPAGPQAEDPTQAGDDDSENTRHVIDYRA